MKPTKQKLKLTLAAHVDDHLQAANKILKQHSISYANFLQVIYDCIDAHGRLFSFGNGGSQSDCEHWHAEIQAAYKHRNENKYPFTTVCLNSHGPTVSAIANDFGYVEIFIKQLESYGVCSSDIVCGFTTSGKSSNVHQALVYAKEQGAYTTLFGGLTDANKKLSEYCDSSFLIDSPSTPTIQEMTITILHAISEEIEKYRIEKYVS